MMWSSKHNQVGKRKSHKQIGALGAAVCVALLSGFAHVAKAQKSPLEIGNRVEMFVDRWLIDSMKGVDLRPSTPERNEVVLTTDKPWEGPSSAYFTAIQDGSRIRLYYRGFCPEDSNDRQVTCMAESSDGVHFTRPMFRLFKFNGSLENNIIWQGVESHNFGPFLDENPAAKPASRYKALAGINSKLYAFQSADGIHWSKIQANPVITDGAFDSLNTAFWDPNVRQYRCYSRYWDSRNNVRAIQVCTSTDFINWTKPTPNRYADGVPFEQFYTNATRPCPGATHQLLSFPKRFVPERTRVPGYKEPGLSDAIFMSSRDGATWDRTFPEAWLRAGTDQRNWTQRSNMPAAGIVQTELDSDLFTMYISRHYQWPDNGLQRITIRKFGFGSVHANRSGGEFTTKPFVMRGSHLLLNMSTSAAGSVRVEVQDDKGTPIPGYSNNECPDLFGDDLDREALWSGNRSGARLMGRTVRLHFTLSDADIFSLRISQ